MKKTLFALILALGLSPAAFAQAIADDSDCGRLHIQVANFTQDTCRLVGSKTIHGNVMVSPPTSLMAGQSYPFDIMETGYGPTEETTYQCGKEQITFRSHQGFCALFLGGAGGVSATIVSHTPGITAKAITSEGSFFWGKPGQLNWEIQKAGAEK